MRFVTPDVVRIPLQNGVDWIDVKRELNVGEDKRYRTAGFQKMTPPEAENGHGDGKAAIEIDWARMSVARVEAYLVDWSAKTAAGKDLAVSRKAIEALAKDDFDEIDAAIQAHIDAQAAAQADPPGAPPPTPTLP